MTIIRFILASLIVSFAFTGVVWSQDIISLGVVTKPGAAQNVCAEKFKDLLESRSRFKVKVFDSGSVGTELEILKKIQKNKLNMGVITSGPFDNFVPEVRVIDYPFLFSSYEQVDKILDGVLGKELLGTIKKAGFIGLGFSENGFRHLTNSRKPVHRVEDLSGLKIRVMESDIHRALWQLLGATPVPIGDLNELVKDLQSGAVDGQENPLSAIWLDGFYKGQKYLAMTGHVYSSHINVANLEWFNALSEKDRKMIERCIDEAVRFQRRWSRENMTMFLNKIRASGITVDEKPEMESFRKRASGIRELDIFQVKEVKELLNKFLEATEK